MENITLHKRFEYAFEPLFTQNSNVIIVEMQQLGHCCLHKLAHIYYFGKLFLQHTWMYTISAYLCSLMFTFLWCAFSQAPCIFLFFQCMFYLLSYLACMVIRYESWFLEQYQFICTDWLVLRWRSAHVMGTWYNKNKPLETYASQLTEPQKQVSIHVLRISVQRVVQCMHEMCESSLQC